MFEREILDLGAAAGLAIGVFLAYRAAYLLLGGLFGSDARRAELADLLKLDQARTASPDRLAAAVALILLATVALGVQFDALPAAAIALVMLVLSGQAVANRIEGERARQLELTLPTALQQIANEMASTGSLDQALEAVSATTPSPAREELALLRARLATLGLEQALERTVRQLDSKSFALMASVIRVGTSRGGNLIQALKDLSATLIEIERLRRKIRTASSSSRRAMTLMLGAALVMPVVSLTMMPMGDQVLSDPRGQLVMFFSLALTVLSLILFSRMTRIKV